ncbi:hypothetical protein AAZX31_06G184400 [Glycine max]
MQTLHSLCPLLHPLSLLCFFLAPSFSLASSSSPAPTFGATGFSIFDVATVLSTHKPLSVELRPRILGNIFNGIRPLKTIAK